MSYIFIGDDSSSALSKRKNFHVKGLKNLKPAIVLSARVHPGALFDVFVRLRC